MMLDYLTLKKTFPKQEMALLFSFASIDSFLNSFSLSNLDKYNLMKSLQHSFKKEFEADKVLKKELDKKYRELANELDYFLKENAKNDFPDFFEIIEKKQIQIAQTVIDIKNKIQISTGDFLSSHIHMMLNRQYTSKQRMYELIIYDHLHRYYKRVHYQKC